jgi:hypothetical protein
LNTTPCLLAFQSTTTTEVCFWLVLSGYLLSSTAYVLQQTSPLELPAASTSASGHCAASTLVIQISLPSPHKCSIPSSCSTYHSTNWQSSFESPLEAI